MTDEMGLSDRFYGYSQALPAAAAMVAAAATGFCRGRTRFGARIQASGGHLERAIE